MRKRILIAEPADTVRTVAENTLRQNGYEVISVAVGDRANEVLQFSRPDLMIIGADLTTSDSTPYYLKMAADTKIGPIPTLIIASTDGSEPEVAADLVIPQPFDPQTLLGKVSAVLENKLQPAAQHSGSGSGINVDDDFLDSALGLDEINVTDSEVMDKTRQPKKKAKKAREVDNIAAHEEDEVDDEKSRVESLVINEDANDIAHNDQPAKEPGGATGTSQLEIVSDQFGMEDLNSGDYDDLAGAHDYDWFVSAMRQENETPPANAKSQGDNSSLRIEPASAAVDPITPGPKGHATAQPKEGSEKTGVEQFIDEFKKEMEVLRAHEPDSIVIKDEENSAKSDDSKLSWEERLEKLTPREVGLFTQRFSRELAERLAEIIAAKINPDKLLELLRAEIVGRARKEQK